MPVCMVCVFQLYNCMLGDCNATKTMTGCDERVQMDGYLKHKEYQIANFMYESSLSFYRNCPHGYRGHNWLAHRLLRPHAGKAKLH